jgi:hypothetical protein
MCAYGPGSVAGRFVERDGEEAVLTVSVLDGVGVAHAKPLLGGGGDELEVGGLWVAQAGGAVCVSGASRMKSSEAMSGLTVLPLMKAVTWWP